MTSASVSSHGPVYLLACRCCFSSLGCAALTLLLSFNGSNVRTAVAGHTGCSPRNSSARTARMLGGHPASVLMAFAQGMLRPVFLPCLYVPPTS